MTWTVRMCRIGRRPIHEGHEHVRHVAAQVGRERQSLLQIPGADAPLAAGICRYRQKDHREVRGNQLHVCEEREGGARLVDGQEERCIFRLSDAAWGEGMGHGCLVSLSHV